MLLLNGVTVVVPPVECHTTQHVTYSTEYESENVVGLMSTVNMSYNVVCHK